MRFPPAESPVTIVTGASSGIGRAAARLFARAGARVVLASRDAARLTALEREIAGYPAEAVAVPTDVTRDDQVKAMAQAALSRFGRIDILICNAGVGLYSPVSALPDAALRRVFEVNFFGVVRCVQAALPSMLQRGSGVIQVVSSVIGRRAVPGYAGYCATKFAVGALVESLRVELDGSGVIAQTIYPGLTDTEFGSNAIIRDTSRRPARVKATPPEVVARRMLRAALNGRRDTVVSAGGHALLALNGLSRSLTDRILARVMGPRATRT